MQLKVTLDQEIYEYLKTNSQQHRRTLSAELNTILEQHLKGAGMFSVPVNHPNTTHSPIPETSTKTKMNIIEEEDEEEDDEDYDKDF